MYVGNFMFTQFSIAGNFLLFFYKKIWLSIWGNGNLGLR